MADDRIRIIDTDLGDWTGLQALSRRWRRRRIGVAGRRRRWVVFDVDVDVVVWLGPVKPVVARQLSAGGYRPHAHDPAVWWRPTPSGHVSAAA